MRHKKRGKMENNGFFLLSNKKMKSARDIAEIYRG